MHSDTVKTIEECQNYTYIIGKSKPLVGSMSPNLFLLDRRFGDILPRYFTHIESERLFLFPDNYTDVLKKVKRVNVIGNTVVIYIILGFIRNIV